jgi:PhnB protein
MIIPFVSVNNALEAIEYYKEVLKAEMNQEMTMLSSIPGYEGEEYKGKVGHSTLIIQGSTIFLNDIIESYPLTPGDNIQFVLDYETEAELRETFGSLAKDGKVVAELQEVHWGALFGTVKDKFGVTWQMYYGHK